METIHNTLSPLVAAHPLLALASSLAIGFLIGMAIFKRKKKDH